MGSLDHLSHALTEHALNRTPHLPAPPSRSAPDVDAVPRPMSRHRSTRPLVRLRRLLAAPVR